MAALGENSSSPPKRSKAASMSFYSLSPKRMHMNEQRSYLNIKDSSANNDTAEIARKFSHRIEKDTGFLAYRDLPQIISAHGGGRKVLDYGCGAGYSTALLKSWGFDVIGVDISQHMISTANKNYPDVNFRHMEINQLPYEDCSFD